MRKITQRFFSCLALLCLLLSGACAEETEQVKKTLDGLGIAYTEDVKVVPLSPPETVPEMRTERIRFNRKKTKELIEKYCLPKKKGESWVCEIHSRLNPDYELYFCEENGLYGSISIDVFSPPVPLDESDEGLCRANETVRNFLDELGIAYEYPFYLVEPYRGFSNEETNLVWFTVRLPMEGIPCNTTIGWTKDSDGTGNGDATPGAFFIATRDGQLTMAIIRNPVNVVSTKEDPTPVKNWDEVLRENLRDVEYFSHSREDEATMTLKCVQFVMMVDAHDKAYPAWAFCYDRHVSKDRESPASPPYTYDLLLTYNAKTGHRVWCWP